MAVYMERYWQKRSDALTNTIVQRGIEWNEKNAGELLKRNLHQFALIDSRQAVVAGLMETKQSKRYTKQSTISCV